MGIFNTKPKLNIIFSQKDVFFIVCFYLFIFYLLLPAISDILSLFVSPLVQNTEIYYLLYIY